MPAPRRRAYPGPAILSYGFRPFLLAGRDLAGLANLVWLPVFHGELSLHSAFEPCDWHVHEMLFGYHDMGERQLKNIDRPIPVYSARCPGEQSLTAEASSRDHGRAAAALNSVKSRFFPL